MLMQSDSCSEQWKKLSPNSTEKGEHGRSELTCCSTLQNGAHRQSRFPTFISCQRQDANVLPKRRQSHQGDKLCDVSTVPLVARWPVFLARGSDADGEPHYTCTWPGWPVENSLPLDLTVLHYLGVSHMIAGMPKQTYHKQNLSTINCEYLPPQHVCLHSRCMPLALYPLSPTLGCHPDGKTAKIAETQRHFPHQIETEMCKKLAAELSETVPQASVCGQHLMWCPMGELQLHVDAGGYPCS